MEQTNNQNRMIDFDVLKGIGILLMVMGHIGFGDYFNKYIHAFHMPLFFFCSGYFFRNDNRGSFSNYIIKSTKSLLIPYFVFSLLCQPLHFIYTHSWDWKYFILSLISSNHNRIDVAGAYWFLLCLFSARILFFVFMRLSNRRVRAIVMVTISVVSAMRFIKLPLCIDSALSMLIFMYFGWLIKQYREHRIIKLICGINPVVCIFGIVVLVPIILMCPDINVRTNSIGLVPVSWLVADAMILFLYNISRALGKMKGTVARNCIRGFSYIGRNSIVYLVLNELTIFAVSFFLGIIHFKAAGIIGSIVITIIVMIVLYLETEVFGRTRLKTLIGR